MRAAAGAAARAARGGAVLGSRGADRRGGLPAACRCRSPGIAGDQQAALFGQACFAAGDTKCTYGTGSFVLVNTGPERPDPGASLLATVAWMDPGGALSYALEGPVFVTGAAVQWLRDGLGLLENAAQSEALARSVPDSGGVVFVPALTGLGAPDWDPDARGAIFGITRGTGPRAPGPRHAGGHRVRGAGRVRAPWPPRTAARPRTLKADGGASENDLLMQLQADQLGLDRGAPGDRGDDRAWRRVPGRPGHRHLV